MFYQYCFRFTKIFCLIFLVSSFQNCKRFTTCNNIRGVLITLANLPCCCSGGMKIILLTYVQRRGRNMTAMIFKIHRHLFLNGIVYINTHYEKLQINLKVVSTFVKSVARRRKKIRNNIVEFLFFLSIANKNIPYIEIKWHKNCYGIMIDCSSIKAYSNDTSVKDISSGIFNRETTSTLTMLFNVACQATN